MKSKHELHQFGLWSAGRLPIIRMTGAAAPAKGAAQSRQRGPCGRSRKIRRLRRSLGLPTVRKSYQKASLPESGGRCTSLMPVHLHGAMSLAAGIAQPASAIEAIFLPLSILQAARALEDSAHRDRAVLDEDL